MSDLFSFRNFRVLLLALTGCAVLFLTIQELRFLPVTGENVYPESSGVLSALRWSHGKPLYEDFRKPPYLSTPFPPLWYGLMAQAAKLSHFDLDSLTRMGRVLSLACLIGIAVISYSWNRRLGCSRSLCVLAPAFFLSIPILVPWAVTARPDLLALMLSILAIYLTANGPGGALIGLSSIVASLAFLARHNSVAAPVAIVLWLAFSRRWKHALLFCVIWGLIVFPVLIGFQISSGGFLFQNLSGGKFGQVSYSYARDILARFLEGPGQAYVIALFGFGLVGFYDSWRQDDRRPRLMCTYTVVALLLAVLGSAAAGSAPNHYLETAMACSCLIPIGLASLEKSWSTGSPLAILATVLVVLFLLPSLDVQRSNMTHNRPDDLRPLTTLVAGSRVFTDIPYLGARDASPEALDLASLINSERSKGGHGWSSAAVVRDLLEKKYPLVILSQPIGEVYVPSGLYPRYPRMDEAMRAAISNNYGLCSHFSNSYIYGPLVADSSSPSCPQRDEKRTAAERIP